MLGLIRSTMRLLDWANMTPQRKTGGGPNKWHRWLKSGRMPLGMVRKIANVLIAGVGEEMNKCRDDKTATRALMQMQESLGELAGLWIDTQESQAEQQDVTLPAKASLAAE